jgi:hypothetical protein
MKPTEMVKKVIELQDEIRTAWSQAKRAHDEKERLVKQIKEKCGERFVSEGVPYEIKPCVSYVSGDNSSDSIVLDTSVRVLE